MILNLPQTHSFVRVDDKSVLKEIFELNDFLFFEFGLKILVMLFQNIRFCALILNLSFYVQRFKGILPEY